MSELFKLTIKTSTGQYGVDIGNGLCGVSSPQNLNDVWLVDKKVAALHPGVIPAEYIAQEAVEANKNLTSVAHILEAMRDCGSTRSTHLAVVGGGIVQDLGTFVSSCYMRGIDWTYYPTTLLGMVDSCIGGKSSLNVGQYKNIAGNFNPPQHVLIDTKFCDTLSDTQLSEGLIEAAKICYADSDQAFQNYRELTGEGAALPRGESLAPIIHLSLQTKKRFIEEDEFDRGIRLLLNFGHTFGHAIEGATHYAINHGTAVGLGILAAEHFATQHGYVKSGLANMNGLTTHIRHLLSFTPDLQANLKEMSSAAALRTFLSDKKHTSDHFIMILFDENGRLNRVRVPKSDSTEAKLLHTFEYLKGLINEIQ